MTTVETSDVRDVIGTGKSIEKLKFPIFHMFDTNWRLKVCSTYSEDVNGHVVSLKLRPQRKSSEDLWEIEALVGISIESLEIIDFWFDWTFSSGRNGVELKNIGVFRGNQRKMGGVEVEAKVFMQIRRSSGIQLRNFIDFSHPYPIFSDAIIRISSSGAQNCDVFHVNQMIMSMASPVIFRKFLEKIDENLKNPLEIEIDVEVENVRDFRRILNLIYPPHLPPKQWIKEHNNEKKLENIRRILKIAKSLEISVVFEKTDEFVMKFCNFELSDALLLAQEFGLRCLMGSKIQSIQSISQIATCHELHRLSNKTKALILDHILTLKS